MLKTRGYKLKLPLRLPEPTRLVGGLISIGLAAWAIAVSLQHSSAATTITNINVCIARSAHDAQTFTISRIMRSAAVLGSPRLTSALAIITGMAMRLWTKSWRPFWILAFLYAGSLILELTLKLAIVRGQSLSGMVAARHSSFPSGHSLRATTIYGALAEFCGGYVGTGVVNFG